MLKNDEKTKTKENLKSEDKVYNEEKFHPPANFSFPFHKIQDKNRSAQHVWFKNFPWLTYSIQKDAVFCHVCQTADHKNLLKTQMKDKGFISKGFTYWHHAVEKFKKHQSSECHSEAVALFIKTDKTKDIGILLNSQKQKDTVHILLKSRKNVTHFILPM